MTHCKQTHPKNKKQKRKKNFECEPTTAKCKDYIHAFLGVSKVCEHFIMMGQIFEKEIKLWLFLELIDRNDNTIQMTLRGDTVFTQIRVGESSLTH